MTRESSMEAHKISTIAAAKIRFFFELRKFIIWNHLVSVFYCYPIISVKEGLILCYFYVSECSSLSCLFSLFSVTGLSADPKTRRKRSGQENMSPTTSAKKIFLICLILRSRSMHSRFMFVLPNDA